ncbi:hypothetical protein ASE92_17510 [Pedobacter sp. Leaf41]|jgi:hypothetical protein|nr:hypothetical protein ASE92_17510 [Pedobacter sp. Leaf41]
MVGFFPEATMMLLWNVKKSNRTRGEKNDSFFKVAAPKNYFCSIPYKCDFKTFIKGFFWCFTIK